VSNLVTAATPM